MYKRDRKDIILCIREIFKTLINLFYIMPIFRFFIYLRLRRYDKCLTYNAYLTDRSIFRVKYFLYNRYLKTKIYLISRRHEQYHSDL